MSPLVDQLQTSRLKSLPARLFTTTTTECFPQASFVHVNTHLLAQWGIEQQEFTTEDNLSLFAGTHSLSHLRPIATVYAGHQFGIYTSRLGDGRVHILGDLRTGNGATWEVQLKGAGATPYARGNNGRMSLAEAITEYLGCEAMAGLGIPSTRGLALIQHSWDSDSGQKGDCILVRTAPGHLRFGHFEYLHNQGDLNLLKDLADHVIAHDYPELLEVAESQRYLQFLYAVTQRTANLLAYWQSVGFVHSVMNTDNMSILGLTLDYGMYGFMREYDPTYSPNADDDQDRYAFNQQVDVARWNCLALAEALVELLPERRIPAALLRHYRQTYRTRWLALLRHKLGLVEIHQDDEYLIGNLLTLLQKQRVDYTRFFRCFSHTACHGQEVVADFFTRNSTQFRLWYEGYQQRLTLENLSAEQRVAMMLANNPKYILRPSLLARVIEQAEQVRDFSELRDLLSVLQSPYLEHERYTHLA